MKKTVLTYGLISGAILSAMMLASFPFMDRIGDYGELLGYSTMVLSFLLVYFGVRSYRDTVRGGSVGFGRAFVVGLGIAFLASACYVVTWEVVYFKFAPDFLDRYSARVIEKARASGESEDAIAQKKAELDKLAVMYQNPMINAAMTFMEPLPVAVIVALVSAGILSRRRKEAPDEAVRAPA